MNASQAFRSHLLQQFATAARNQARTTTPPIALAGWIGNNNNSVATVGSNNNNNNNNNNSDDISSKQPVRRRQYYNTTVAATSGSVTGGISEVSSHQDESIIVDNQRGSSYRSRISKTKHSSTRMLSSLRSLEENNDINSDNLDSLNGAAITISHMNKSAATTISPTTIPSSPSDLAIAFQNLLQTRRTGSKYIRSDDVKDLLSKEQYSAAIDRAVIAGRAAPNHKRTEPFTFKRILGPSSPVINELANIAAQVQIRTKKDAIPQKDILLQSAERKRDKWNHIPAFLVTLVKSNQIQDGTEYHQYSNDDSDDDNHDDDMYDLLPYYPPQTEREMEDYAAACAATQNVLLSLHSENFITKWATGPVIRTKAFRNLIQAQPTDRIVGLIMIGQNPPNNISQPKPRRFRRELHGDVLQDL